MAVVVICALLVFSIYSLTSGPGAVTTQVPSVFMVGGTTYHFNYTATTQAERENGLMNKKITNATTMLFVFPTPGRWQFWMYDTNTSLDMIWINATGNKGVVVYVVPSAPPCLDRSTCPVYTPSSNANYVVEAHGGFAAANGISAGTVVGFG